MYNDDDIIDVLSSGIRDPQQIKKVLKLNFYYQDSEYRRFESRVKHISRLRQYGIPRKEIYSIEYILPLIDEIVDLDGDVVNLQSLRYKTFRDTGLKCVSCGVEAAFFAKERHVDTDKYHLNLYAYNHEGLQVTLTKDHIVPRSKGGANHITNMQTMCRVCNEKKSDILHHSSNFTKYKK